jgi:hypothetical protein
VTDNTQVAKETSKQITVYLKATNYSSKNNKNSYGVKSKGKVLSIHAMKIYRGVKL